jgi:hypothetical protein
MKDSLPILANAGAISLYLANINQILTGISLLAAISYTLYKFYKETKKQN